MDMRPQGPVQAAVAGEPPIDPELRIGHVHLRTADIDRVRAFYVGVMGFDVVFEARDVPGWGTTGDILFLSAGGYHHHLGFNTWKSKGGAPQPDGVTGLHHVALNFSSRERLAEVVRRLDRRRGRAAPARGPRHASGRVHVRPRRQRPRAGLGPPLRGVAAAGRGPGRSSTGPSPSKT